MRAWIIMGLLLAATVARGQTTIYVGTGDAGGYNHNRGGDVYRSSDSGATWTKIADAALHFGFVDTGAQNPSIEAIAQLDPSTLLVSFTVNLRSKVFRSGDGGATWTNVTPVHPSGYSYPFSDVRRFLVLSSTTVYAVAAYGLFLSLDGGINWALVGNPGDPNGDVNSPVADYGDFGRSIFGFLDVGQPFSAIQGPDGKIWLGVQRGYDAAVFRSASPAVGAWELVATSFGTFAPLTGVLYAETATLVKDSVGNVYAALGGGYPGRGFVLKTSDSGASWAPVPSQPTQDYSNLYGMVIDPSDRISLPINRAPTPSVASSTDGGASWTLVNGVSGPSTSSISSNLALEPGGSLLFGESFQPYRSDPPPLGFLYRLSGAQLTQIASCANDFGGDQFPSAVTAYASTSYPLHVDLSGSGTVTSSPAGLVCGGAGCDGSFTRVTLTAAPANGFLFTGWGGACTGSGPCTLSLTGATGVTAQFAAVGVPAGTTITSTVTDPATGSTTYTLTAASGTYAVTMPSGSTNVTFTPAGTPVQPAIQISATLPPGAVKSITIPRAKALKLCVKDDPNATLGGTCPLANTVTIPPSGQSCAGTACGGLTATQTISTSSNGQYVTVSGLRNTVLEMIGDSDGDGVPDQEDHCPNTILSGPIPSQGLRPGHLGDNQAILGCNASQILACKPGENEGERKFGVTPGSQNIFASKISSNPIGWARACLALYPNP